jgi:sporulation protein YlmC with PRC-barrel domain
MAKTTATATADSRQIRSDNPQIIAASALTGDRVINLGGQTLGELKHIMLDIETGCIAYAVLATGGVLGFGDKLLAIPWHALKFDAARDCFILNIEKERIEEAEGFDKDRWPSAADPRWAVPLQQYADDRMSGVR